MMEEISAQFAKNPSIDLIDLLHPFRPLTVTQLQDVFWRPMQVIGDECYLLVQAIGGVAYDPPRRIASTSNSWAQFGQVTDW